MRIDWGDGDYARTAAELAPVAEILAERAGVRAGQRVLDVACGTGNAALAAARRGARATGVDPAPALLQRARERAWDAGLRARFVAGDAGRLPLPDAAADVTLSCFGVIFAPDPGAAIAEMRRVTRPAGTIALTSWRDDGPISRLAALARAFLPQEERPPWDDPEWIRDLLAGHGAAEIGISQHVLAVAGESPERWLADLEEHHPVWRAARRRAGAAAWERLRCESLATLAAGNEDASAFRVSSPYVLACARLESSGRERAPGRV